MYLLSQYKSNIVKNGKSLVGKQRYRCQNDKCSYSTFTFRYSYSGRSRDVKQTIVIVEMSFSGSGVKDISS